MGAGGPASPVRDLTETCSLNARVSLSRHSGGPRSPRGPPRRHVDLSGAHWRKSTYSNGQGGCVEVSDGHAGAMPVRDSKDPQGPSLLFPADAWRAFVTAVQGGEFGTV
ncbi:DUF397 domain-containing protein [Kitasatospora purpeofusca]|uniref:DUF397 domain-containing protein n=1 Tax=Kitasatospora purpeofusca TaxID=67352 RepID=UPI003812FE00